MPTIKVFALIERLKRMPPDADAFVYDGTRCHELLNEPLMTSGQNEYGRAMILSVGIPMRPVPNAKT